MAKRLGDLHQVPVAIVGAGPVGFSLALGLARRGVRCVLLERRAGTSERSKAPAIHVRTREALRLWGVEERLLAAGALRRELTLYDVGRQDRELLTVGFSGLEEEAEQPGLLVLEQGRTEAILLQAVRETGLCDVRFGAEAVGLETGEETARVTIRLGGRQRYVEASYVVGCDGASSFVRQALGLSFDGITYSVRPVLADVRLDDRRDTLPWPRISNRLDGFAFTVRLGEGLWRLVRLERGKPRKEDDVSLEEVRPLVDELLGPGPVEVVWASRFQIHRRAVSRFRVGQVLLAGDAAHVHSPAGGMGMNAGLQDAHNLAWKLASALKGGDTERLLASYDEERRTVTVGRVSRYTDIVTRAFVTVPAPVRALAFVVWRLGIRIPPLRRRNLRRATMIDLGYSTSSLLDPGAQAAGVRLPDPLLRTTAGEEVRLYRLLGYRPVLLEVGEVERIEPHPAIAAVIRIGPGGHSDPSGLLRGLLGGRDGWILVRPDGHVAWARREASGIHQAIDQALGAKERSAVGASAGEI
jgi:2-polyprenyl-6-methoxyphenol hydroxylase-like FAD-dependent oxidoreductase